MDQIKIGQFISECRKEKKLTQAQLAEKLCITDKAISKWERGLAMPDSAIMLELCGILGINVNELLRGERIDAAEERQKTDELLLEMTKREEKQRKRLFQTSWRMFAFWSLFYFFTSVVLFIFVEKFLLGVVLNIIVFVLYLGGGFILVVAELRSTLYVCQNCQHVFETKQIFAINTFKGKPENWKYYLKCPKCNKKTWAKRIFSK